MKGLRIELAQSDRRGLDERCTYSINRWQGFPEVCSIA
jgi:hypothetical protein